MTSFSNTTSGGIGVELRKSKADKYDFALQNDFNTIYHPITSNNPMIEYSQGQIQILTTILKILSSSSSRRRRLTRNHLLASRIKK